jgi:hypothetical protein
MRHPRMPHEAILKLVRDVGVRQRLHQHDHRRRHSIQPAVPVVHARHRCTDINGKHNSFRQFLRQTQFCIWFASFSINAVFPGCTVDNFCIVQIPGQLIFQPFAFLFFCFRTFQHHPQFRNVFKSLQWSQKNTFRIRKTIGSKHVSTTAMVKT